MDSHLSVLIQSHQDFLLTLAVVSIALLFAYIRWGFYLSLVIVVVAIAVGLIAQYMANNFVMPRADAGAITWYFALFASVFVLGKAFRAAR